MRVTASIAFSLLTLSLVAQPKASPTEVTIDSVSDRRTNGSFSQLTLVLLLPKVLSSDVAASRVVIAAASDNTGRSLLEPEAREPQLEANMRGMMGAPKAAPATVSLTLLNPARTSTTLAEVRGEIELFMPGKDPNSVAEVPKFMAGSGKAISHKALKANGIEMALMSNSQLEAERKRLAEVKRKEYKSSGWEDGEDLESMVRSYSESLLTVQDSDVLVRIKDPNQRIQEIAYVDDSGKVQLISTRTEDGLTYLSTWGEKPKADWKLRVSMKTAKNLVRHSFTLKNVALP